MRSTKSLKSKVQEVLGAASPRGPQGGPPPRFPVTVKLCCLTFMEASKNFRDIQELEIQTINYLIFKWFRTTHQPI